MEEMTLGHAKISEDVSTFDDVDDGKVTEGGVDVGSKVETDRALVGTADVDVLELDGDKLGQRL